MSDNQTREKRRMGAGDRFVIIVLAVLVVLSIALAVLKAQHIQPIAAEITLFLPFLILFLLLGWGASALFRRMKRRAVKILVGGGLGLLLFLAVVLVFSYVSFVATVALPRAYSRVTSPSGKHRLVLMRRLDDDEARVNARKDARLAANPEGDPEVTVEDWGYVYSAYPQVAHFFYRDDVDSEGQVVMGYSSPATLMVEWADGEGSARFYADNPGVGDEGELTLRF